MRERHGLAVEDHDDIPLNRGSAPNPGVNAIEISGKSDNMFDKKRRVNPLMASLFPPTPYPALMSIPTVALSSVTAKAFI